MPLSDFEYQIPSRAIVDREGRPLPELQQWLDQLIRSINGNAVVTNTIETDLGTAETDIVANNVAAEDVNFSWWTDTSGTNPAGDPTKDLIVTFKRQGSTIATRTIRGALNSATGNITITDQANSGDACTVTITGSGTPDGKAVIQHDDSGVIGKATFSIADISASGGSPSK